LVSDSIVSASVLSRGASDGSEVDSVTTTFAVVESCAEMSTIKSDNFIRVWHETDVVPVNFFKAEARPAIGGTLPEKISLLALDRSCEN